jgi:hypothetical protein
MTRWRQAVLGVGVSVGLQLSAWALHRTIEGHRDERMAPARFDYEPTNGTSPPPVGSSPKEELAIAHHSKNRAPVANGRISMMSSCECRRSP